MTIVNQVVDRCHVSDSNRKIIKYVISCLARGYASFQDMPKDHRKTLMQLCIKRHTANRENCTEVSRLGGSKE